MKTKWIAVLLAVASLASFSGCGGSSQGNEESVDLCEFNFYKDGDVTIMYFSEHSYFELNKNEDEFDLEDLEFVSENPEIATFTYDKTTLGNCIYYNINPISKGETYVYVKCNDCGAESRKIHVTVEASEDKINKVTTAEQTLTEAVETETLPSETVEMTEEEQENIDYTASPDPNTTEMVDYIASKAKDDATSATSEQLQEAVDFLKNNTKSYFSGNENMENTMYYGCLLEAYYSGTNNAYEQIGFQAFKTVKYVYRGIDSVFDEETYSNVKELQEMAENLPDIQ